MSANGKEQPLHIDSYQQNINIDKNSINLN